MTFSQIKKTRAFLSRIDELHGFAEIDSFVGELRAFYDIFFDIKLEVYIHNTASSYSIECEEKDKLAIRSFLESQLAKNDKNISVFKILDLMDEGEKSIGNIELMNAFISKVYYSYNDKILLDKTTEFVATAPAEVVNFGMTQATDSMVTGLVAKLENYGTSLLSDSPHKTKKLSTSVVINNTNTATASVNIDITIEQAKHQAKNAGLGDEQLKAVMDKLSEIESIGKSGNSKGTKWEKAKEVLKWCAKQGIEIAKIILPVLPKMLDN